MSTELKKGDLVMTEHGLAWYKEQSECADTGENMSHYVVSLVNGGTAYVLQAFPATRAEVEAYLKEKGWKYCSTKYGEWYRKYYVWDIRENKRIKKWGFQVPFINYDEFDTAQEQLAEAILMARLLNATK